MAAVKVTFTLDAETVTRLRTTAERLHIPQSRVVREAIAEYGARAGRLSEVERVGMLKAFDKLAATRSASGPVADVEAELRALRAARRQGGRARRER
jgi:hypothetical protein